MNDSKHIRKIFRDKRYPIMIDQEGGRVNRLEKFISLDSLFPNLNFSEKFCNDGEFRQYIDTDIDPQRFGKQAEFCSRWYIINDIYHTISD